ncbi:MAG: hypothetical protein JWO52_7965 [Gammaproteobacteria bacterium]|jgi:uncharacterized repeat protein (TIGR03803 family)|nr:hypothetical protein [Gammaproteobacteria bacterium]
MTIQWLKSVGVLAPLVAMAILGNSALADGARFSVLHTFEVADPITGDSKGGSQPDTRPVIGPGGSVYGMTYTGGANGTGVIYRYDGRSEKYTVLHTFGALDGNGANEDGAFPGVALTRGRGEVFYGMASFGGDHGNGTVFGITASGKFTVLHTFSATDSNGFNTDGANPLRAIVAGDDGSLYGTTRTGGTHGLGVAWVMNIWGGFSVLHQFISSEGHPASLLEARDGFFYGCAVWPKPSLGSGVLYRMAPSGGHFEVLYRFTAVDANADNADGANCYEPLVETRRGVFYGTTLSGGPNGNGVVFRYSLADPSVVDVVHAFSAVNASGQNSDGANPYARLTRGDDGNLYSTASFGGAAGNGVVYRIRPDGDFKVLHTFSAVDPTTGANRDGAEPDFGVVLDEDGDSLIGMADYGGNGSADGGIGNGTLFRLKLDR